MEGEKQLHNDPHEENNKPCQPDPSPADSVQIDKPNSSSLPASQPHLAIPNIKGAESQEGRRDPVIGMAFETENAAYDCYSEYAKKMGFTVRWDNRTLSRRTGVTLARRFVCSKQGRRGDGQKKRHSQAKYHREETRCGCLAYMKIKLAGDGKYRIIELNASHNHPLSSQVPFNYALANLVLYNHPMPNQVPIQIANLRPPLNHVPNIRPVSVPIPVPNLPHSLSSAHVSGVPSRPVAVFVPISPQQVQNPNHQHPGHMMIMQRVPSSQGLIPGKTKRRRKSAVAVEMANDGADKRDDEVHLERETQASDLEALESLPDDARNYLPTRRTNPMGKSDVDDLLEYFRDKQAQSSSFFYSFQLDADGKIVNVFWMDGKMKTDYARFGDAVCIDTTYRMNDYGRPIAFFTGINHHKQTIIFGAALIYDETGYSYKWVFSTFLKAVGGRRPAAVFTDDNSSILVALSEFGDIPHRLCIWHIYQNAMKNLAKVFTGSKDFEDDFARCIYDHDVEDEFVQEWNSMLEKYNLVENMWLRQRFRERERWAPAYGKTAFCGDIHSAQHRERMNKELRKHLSSSKDMEGFLQGFEKFLDDRRSKETESNAKMMKSSPYAPPVSIIQQAARVYTTAAFDMFMAEYVAGLECLVRERNSDGPRQILVIEDGNGYKHQVRVNLEEESLSCSCFKFERVGFLCGHILTCINKKLRSIPERYILRRWTRCAGNMMLLCELGDERERDILSHRYESLVHDFVRLSVRAGEDEEIYGCVLKHKEAMAEEMEKVFKEKTSSPSYHLFGEHVW